MCYYKVSAAFSVRDDVYSAFKDHCANHGIEANNLIQSFMADLTGSRDEKSRDAQAEKLAHEYVNRLSQCACAAEGLDYVTWAMNIRNNPNAVTALAEGSQEYVSKWFASYMAAGGKQPLYDAIRACVKHEMQHA